MSSRAAVVDTANVRAIERIIQHAQANMPPSQAEALKMTLLLEQIRQQLNEIRDARLRARL